MNHHEKTADHGCGDEGPFFFDEQGELVDDPSARPAVSPRRDDLLVHTRPCSMATLNGSWLIELTPWLTPSPFLQIRGPMRLEVGASSLRISGDVYVRRGGVIGPGGRPQPGGGPGPVPPESPAQGDTAGYADGVAEPLLGEDVVGPRPWYPQLPMNEYSWYFRSTGATYANGRLDFSFARHLWDRTSQEFVSSDNGRITLTCRRPLFTPFGRPVKMAGTATIGGRSYAVTATKTSTMYRGCRIEVDAMTTRVWPDNATITGGVVTTFRLIYASAGWDVAVTVDELAVPEDTSLTNAELQTLLAAHRGPGTATEWRLWLLVGSAQGGIFGVMFDDDAIPREGAVGFADATLPDVPVIEAGARNRPLDEVPAAFLRTLVHEAGHALNLFHPKHDVHAPPIGTQIMNQTGDVMSFASAADPYPGNASFTFAAHDAVSLVHSPDPQVRPGWKGFGWGHGSASAGLPEPTDATGLVNEDDAEGLELVLHLPETVFVGEYVTAEVVLTNVGQVPQEVSTRLNLAEGDLRLLHVLPDGSVDQVRDVVLACGPRPTVVLEPGGTLTGLMQVFFTSEGVTFETPGKHILRAELDVDSFRAVRSARVVVHVRSATSGQELDVAAASLDHGVGRAFALGDFGADDHARDNLVTLADDHHESITGGAAALVLANSFARTHTDYREGTLTRDLTPDRAGHYLDLASQGRSAEQLMKLATTVASPIEKDAPVVADALAHSKEAAASKGDLARARVVQADFVEPSPR
jgi:hypothetical protein